jgi:hypothetical protein
MRVQGHEIRVRTIDLALPWPELEQELLHLLERGNHYSVDSVPRMS